MYEEGRDREICNHDEGNQHLKNQEDLTRKSLGKDMKTINESLKT